VPTMAWTEPPPDLVFRPVVDPAAFMTWAAFMRSGDRSPGTAAFLAGARALADELGWLGG
jgi:hypothetical protein